jgi:hypothetical protein
VGASEKALKAIYEKARSLSSSSSSCSQTRGGERRGVPLPVMIVFENFDILFGGGSGDSGSSSGQQNKAFLRLQAILLQELDNCSARSVSSSQQNNSSSSPTTSPVVITAVTISSSSSLLTIER